MTFEIRKSEIRKTDTINRPIGFFGFGKRSSISSTSNYDMKKSQTIINPNIGGSITKNAAITTELKKSLNFFPSRDPKKDEKYFSIQNEEALKADTRTWNAGEIEFTPWDIARLNHNYAMGKKN
jgi:hypothetical protein